MNENNDFTEVSGLDSLEMAPFADFWDLMVPFADFRVKNQTLICHTSKLTCYLEVLSPSLGPKIIKMLLLSNNRLGGGGGARLLNQLNLHYDTTFDIMPILPPRQCKSIFFPGKDKIDEVVKLLRLMHTSDIVLQINIFSV